MDCHFENNIEYNSYGSLTTGWYFDEYALGIFYVCVHLFSSIITLDGATMT